MVCKGLFKVVLEDDTKQLEEVVVVGYGQQKKKAKCGRCYHADHWKEYWNGRLVFLILVQR